MSTSSPYDVAISFAGEDRAQAHALAVILRERGVRVFYDDFEEATLWGKDLYTHLSDVYRHQARYCVMLVSRHYPDKMGTKHERAAAQARAINEHAEYILPVRLDETEIPGVLPTIGYLSWSPHTADSVADALMVKLRVSKLQEAERGSADRTPGGTGAMGGDGASGGATISSHGRRKPEPSPYIQRHDRKATHRLIDKLNLMRDRFRYLLDAHRVPLSIVPVLLRDFDLPLSALDDDDHLADLLTEELIAFMCATFHVERAWLRGESPRATLHRPAWYKCPDAFCANLVARRGTNLRVRVHFIRDVKPQSRLHELFGQDKLDAGVVIESEHSPVPGVTFSTYERCEEQAWAYWKSRLFYKGIVLFCDQAQERHGLDYVGDLLTSDAFAGLSAGTLLPVAALSSGICGHWYPWEYVSTDYARARETDEIAQVCELFQGWSLETYLTPALWASPSEVRGQ